MLKKLTNKKLLIDEEKMIDPIEINKSLVEKIQVVEKGTNTNLIEVKTMWDVGVQMMETSSVLINKSSSINNATLVHEENKTPK
jgi:hypothetical protein